MRINVRSCNSVLAVSFLLLSCTLALAKTKSACDDPEPAKLCNAANTCGSTSATCTIDVTRSSAGASVKPGIPKAKGDKLFCVKAGDKLVWMSSRKNTGFSISFGEPSPFEPSGTIVGGGAKPITVTARTPGCYQYDAGAFSSGSIYGMSSGNKHELVILP